MLKNPLHLFRTDFAHYDLPLFGAKIFPRSLQTTRSLNQVIADLHLKNNRVLNSIPKHRIVRDSIFNTNHNLDVRLEDPYPERVRFKVINDHEFLNAATKSQIRIKLTKAADEIIEKHAVDETDILIYAKPNVLFTSDKEASDEVYYLLNYAKRCKTMSKDIPNLLKLNSDLFIYRYLISKTYQNRGTDLNKTLVKIRNNLKDENSQISV